MSDNHEIVMNQNLLQETMEALTRLSRCDVPVTTRARTNKLLDAARALVIEYQNQLRPLIMEYTMTEENPNGDNGIDEAHPRWSEFEADDRVKELLAEKLVVDDVRPLLLSEIIAAESRLDKRQPPESLNFPNGDQHLLTISGFIREDVDL